MKIKSIKVAVSFWGSFKVRGDSYLEFQAECPNNGLNLEEAKKAYLGLSRAVTLECALDALSRGQISKDHYKEVKDRFEKAYEKRSQLLNKVGLANESE